MRTIRRWFAAVREWWYDNGSPEVDAGLPTTLNQWRARRETSRETPRAQQPDPYAIRDRINRRLREARERGL